MLKSRPKCLLTVQGSCRPSASVQVALLHSARPATRELMQVCPQACAFRVHVETLNRVFVETSNPRVYVETPKF